MTTAFIGWTNSRTRLWSGVAGSVGLMNRSLERHLHSRSFNLYSKVPAAGFEPARFGLKELARLSV